jgi:phage shock protein A
MFDNLRDAFREAVDNFRHELNRDDDVPPTVNRLLLAMQAELAQARDLVSALERQIADAQTQVARDREEENTCRRRAEMATKVGDEETARIALEYATRYERRRVVMERKVIALDEEKGIRIVELTEMTERIEEARSKRDHLAEAAEGSDADETLRAADDLFDEIDRMANEAEAGPERRRTSMDELEREFRDLRVDPWAPTPRKQIDVDAALDELKRRMKSD